MTEPSTRERILSAAIDEFSARGFDGTSTTTIARHCGVTQPLIHYHFGNKDGLWRAAMDHLFDGVGRELQGAFPATNGEAELRAELRALVRCLVRICGRDPRFARLLYLELAVAGARRDWLIESRIAPLGRQIAAWQGSRQSLGPLRALPPDRLIAVISGVAATTVALGQLTAEDWHFDPANNALIEHHAELLMAMLDRAIFRPAVPVA